MYIIYKALEQNSFVVIQLESALKAAETAQASLRADRANSRASLFTEEEFKSLQFQVQFTTSTCSMIEAYWLLNSLLFLWFIFSLLSSYNWVRMKVWNSKHINSIKEFLNELFICWNSHLMRVIRLMLITTLLASISYLAMFGLHLWRIGQK